ncbi:hypothetical protein [Desulfobacca acetoxidans]|uniref:Uncharacterized protein n=1 Tax=Desulfobacca acetoxidans (strain ATCC 700848 / DSM 11109 / ASRB2) TaxID=880072 RepID=F2NCX9_DESAR|nr:hypothetical protein [Desulfobacca acetoxidans]AEB09553.1 hypothetical protein Desac_1712 [Desulfobacca acetoxidans DSM 11109]HAY21256.1 hypothetical protein [Desulfobacterales bacterium]
MNKRRRFHFRGFYQSCLVVEVVVLLALLAAGCQAPSRENQELSSEAVQHTIDHWNPSFAKVIDFYGLHFPHGKTGDVAEAYVLLTNPADREKKLTVFEAQLKRLYKSDGQPQWHLTALVSHGLVGGQRLGWDNLMTPIQTAKTTP